MQRAQIKPFLSSYLQGVQDKGLVSHVALYNKGIREMKEKKVCLRFPSSVPIDGLETGFA